MNRWLVFLLVPLFWVTHLHAQNEYINDTYLKNNLNSDYIFKTLFEYKKQFYYRRSDALNDAVKFKSLFEEGRMSDSTLLINIKNTFQEKDSILIDSAFISILLKHYNDFFTASNAIGEPNFYRVDKSLYVLAANLEPLYHDLIFQDKIWNNLNNKISNFCFWDIDKSDSIITKPLRLSSKLDSIKQEIKESKSVVKMVVGNSLFDKKCDSILSLISVFQTQNLSGNLPIKVTENFLDSAYSLFYYSNSFSHNIDYEKVTLQDAIDKSREKFSYDDDKKYILISLFSIDQITNYDTSFLYDRRKITQDLIKNLGLDALLELHNLRLEKNGTFVFRFVFKHIKRPQVVFLKFLGEYQSIYSDKDEEKIYEDFKTKLFFKVGNIFRIPPNNFSLILIRPYLGGSDFPEIIEHKKGVTQTIVLPCNQCFAHTRTIVHSDELTSNMSKLSNYLDENKGRIENIIFQAIVKYLNKKNINSNNLQRIKVEDGEVIVWLNNVRKEILVNENYWENIQYHISTKKIGTDLQISLITDAEIGTGIKLGSIGEPPSYKGYIPIEPKFSIQLQKYTSEFLYKIKDILLN